MFGWHVVVVRAPREWHYAGTHDTRREAQALARKIRREHPTFLTAFAERSSSE